jgi:hypothetical protein
MTYEHIKRFVLLMEEFRKMEPRDTAHARIVMPNGDTGVCYFFDFYIGGVYLRDIAEEVAWANVKRVEGETKAEHFTRFCDALEADFVRRQKEAAA